MIATNDFVVENADTSSGLTKSAWKPEWMVNCGQDCAVGLAVDDGCFVVLYQHENQWKPGSHIPKAAAEQIARLLRENVLN